MAAKNGLIIRFSVLCLAIGSISFLSLRIPEHRCEILFEKLEFPRAVEVNTSNLLRGIRNVSVQFIQVEKACELTKNVDSLRLFKDLISRVEGEDSHVLGEAFYGVPAMPGDAPTTAHYVWCGEKLFRFEDYLGVLSVIRVLKPLKLVFHYNHLPFDNEFYHTWFQELRQSLPHLILKPTNKELKCNTLDALSYALDQLASSPVGGVYFGERAVLTFIPPEWKTENHVTYTSKNANRSEETIIYVKHGLISSDIPLEQFKQDVLNKSYVCMDSETFNAEVESLISRQERTIPPGLSPCLIMSLNLYPENIVNTSTHYAGVARRLYYGKSNLMVATPSQDPNDLIPNVGHMIAVKKKPDSSVELIFQQYLCILSALYVAKIDRIYFYGDEEPTGIWWSRLKGENITFVQIESLETVYQQALNEPAHKSDILRAIILSKFGGIYFDRDVIWANPPSLEIRRYPSVMSLDWPIYNGWPQAGSIGLLMAKPGASFVTKLLESFWYFRDFQWAFNGVLMPYKVYEQNPESIFIDKKLQVICFVGVCHPLWHADYHRTFDQRDEPTGKFKLSETNAFHFTWPKPDPVFFSFSTIRNGTGIVGELGRQVLAAVEKSGRLHLLEESDVIHSP
ncbi:uncharacterized protein LOC131932883 [Physella acuta]|uniref:uncharacterized protein LOC131932883 n=1 Tax=Physella acuta TaxID=109671 RepID=UPI0027DD2AF7|nr:uncharacterized protein LOC131932883 [Physella acuta]